MATSTPKPFGLGYPLASVGAVGVVHGLTTLPMGGVEQSFVVLDTNPTDTKPQGLLVQVNNYAIADRIVNMLGGRNVVVTQDRNGLYLQTTNSANPETNACYR